MGHPDSLLSLRRESGKLPVEDQPEDRIVHHELHCRPDEAAQTVFGTQTAGDPGDEVGDHPGQSLFDQRGDEIVSVPEVLVEGGTSDPDSGCDVSQRDVGGAAFGQEGVGRLQDLPALQFLVGLDVLGADTGHAASLRRGRLLRRCL